MGEHFLSRESPGGINDDSVPLPTFSPNTLLSCLLSGSLDFVAANLKLACLGQLKRALSWPIIVAKVAKANRLADPCSVVPVSKVMRKPAIRQRHQIKIGFMVI